MTKYGRVVALNGNMALVVTQRESACGENCANCKGACKVSGMKFYAENKIGASLGDEVLVYTESKKFFISLIFLYILPVILVFVSSYLGSYVFKNDLITVLFFIISLFLWIAVIKKVNKLKFSHTIVKVVGKDD